MRFISMVKSAETQGPPPRELMEAMARGPAGSARTAKVVEMGGLTPSAIGARVRVERGKLRVIDGPFAESKEVIGGYAILEGGSREEAVEAARWLMQLHLEHWPGWEGEAEVRQLFGPGDLPPGVA